jgi:hypothetical protein
MELLIGFFIAMGLLKVKWKEEEMEPLIAMETR